MEKGDGMIPLDQLTEEEVYQKLREHVDKQSFGYMAVPSGAEMIMLKRFFTPEDALNYIQMPPDRFFSIQEFAQTVGKEPSEVEGLLYDMSKRGLLYREHIDGELMYHTSPAAHGIFEYNVDNIEPGWGGGLLQTLAEGLLPKIHQAKIPMYRSHVISADTVKGSLVIPEDDAKDFVANHERWALARCACRDVVKAGTGTNACNHSHNTCLVTDETADFYVENGIAKPLTKEEALAVIQASIDDKLVIQSSYSKRGEIICSCCSCCCAMLQTAKFVPGEAMSQVSHYVIEEDHEACKACGSCAKACPMQAITIDEAGYAVTSAACVGCGHCVPECKFGARTLVPKTGVEFVPLPETLFDAYNIMEERRRELGDL